MHNELLKHVVKAIEFRFNSSVQGYKPGFGGFIISDHTRSPEEIVNHMTDLLRKTNAMVKERHFRTDPPEKLFFEEELTRFLSTLRELWEGLDVKEIDIDLSKRLLQGPLLDITTHIGQIAMLNGLHGNKIPWKNYFAADI